MSNLTIRNARLKQMLNERRQTIEDELMIRARRQMAEPSREHRDEMEMSESDTQHEIAFSLLQLQSDTLVRIDAALARLAAGTYGTCSECGDAISERRLEALPFAARCQTCEQERELARVQSRAGRGRHSVFSETLTS